MKAVVDKNVILYIRPAIFTISTIQSRTHDKRAGWPKLIVTFLVCYGNLTNKQNGTLWFTRHCIVVAACVFLLFLLGDLTSNMLPFQG